MVPCGIPGMPRVPVHALDQGSASTLSALDQESTDSAQWISKSAQSAQSHRRHKQVRLQRIAQILPIMKKARGIHLSRLHLLPHHVLSLLFV